ncbi:MAG: hypothetical protein ACREUK_11865, partial [Burkholderiales bacterium]
AGRAALRCRARARPRRLHPVRRLPVGARAVSPIRLLEPDDPVYAWRERVMDLFGGYAREAKGFPVWA